MVSGSYASVTEREGERRRGAVTSQPGKKMTGLSQGNKVSVEPGSKGPNIFGN